MITDGSCHRRDIRISCRRGEDPRLINDKLLRRIDRAARALGLTRSAYLSRIAAREVGAERGPGTDQRARRAMAQLDRLFQQQSHPEDATIAIRAERDSR